MDAQTALQMAQEYAKSFKHDDCRPLGKRNGYYYFYVDYIPAPRYIGFQRYVRISPKGELVRMLSQAEINWASKQL